MPIGRDLLRAYTGDFDRAVVARSAQWGRIEGRSWQRRIQSGERVRGRESALGALSVQDDAPTPVGEPRIVGGGDTWVVPARQRR
jgi:hypothetical protein